VATQAQVAVEDIDALDEVRTSTVSLHEPASVEGETELGDLLPDADAEPVDDVVAVNLRADALRSALERLSPRTRRVLELRYGLAGGDPMNLDVIGREVGLTRERVRQRGPGRAGPDARRREPARSRVRATPWRQAPSGAWPAPGVRLLPDDKH
jgi:DNA-directed RNA polymerase sigma subunit (sigma70/sigma32)